MAIVDEDMTIFLANSEFEKMVGYTKREMEEVASFLAFVASDDAEKVKEFHNLIRKDMESRPRHYEFRLKDRAGNIRNIHVTLDMIPETPRTVYSLIDITELRKIEDDLRYELTRKREFITIAAHELRTPLQPVLGYLQLLLEDPDAYCLNAEVRGILDTCRKNAEQERQMVDQIVRLSGLGCGPEQMLPRFRPQYREMSPNNLLKSRISLLSCPHESSIAIEIPENLRIRTDSEYFYLIIESLLFNAFRHSTGPANIEISCHESEQTNSFAIRNTRTVISPEIMANLFRPFYVGDESKLRKKFGFIGLSLPLAKKMAEMLGGDITASSRPGTGTVFTLTLPKSVE
jgi:PAS domain S-box-containing protein